MHYKNEAMAIAMTLVTPDMRKSNKLAKISGGSRRANSKLRTA